jgi:type IV secretory pathway VirJ component
LVGYSFGADVLPFMASRLPPDLQEKVTLMVFLGLGKNASFEFHLSDWIGGTGSRNTLPIQPEVEKLGWVKRLCIFGVEESDSGCPQLAQEDVVVLQVPGDHHFDEDYKGIAQRILQQIPP